MKLFPEGHVHFFYVASLLLVPIDADILYHNGMIKIEINTDIMMKKVKNGAL